MERGKIIFYIAMSLDGFIARENGAIDWLGGQGDVENPDYGYDAFLKTIDTVVMGWTTYDHLVNELSPDVWAYPDQKSLIVTHREANLPVGQAIVTPSQIVEAVEAEVRAGKNVWIVGGAKTVEPFLQANLIDEYVVTIIPTLLGAGVRLFPRMDEVKLRLTSSQVFDGMNMLTYTRR